jgi:hypothetical protein
MSLTVQPSESGLRLPENQQFFTAGQELATLKQLAPLFRKKSPTLGTIKNGI